MRVKIYQIDSASDEKNLKFQNLKELQKHFGMSKVDANLYKQVFNGELEETGIEEIYSRFNQESHPLFRGHSLSVSDVVVTEEGAFFCDSFGFEKIEFNEDHTQKPENLIRELYVEPGKQPYVTEITNDYEGQNRAVGGLIEYIYNPDRTIFVVNEEHKINGMQGNRRIEGDVIAGPFFVVGNGGEDLCSLTDEQLEKYMERFLNPEEIPQSEIEEHLFCRLFIQSM